MFAQLTLRIARDCTVRLEHLQRLLNAAVELGRGLEKVQQLGVFHTIEEHSGNLAGKLGLRDRDLAVELLANKILAVRGIRDRKLLQELRAALALGARPAPLRLLRLLPGDDLLRLRLRRGLLSGLRLASRRLRSLLAGLRLRPGLAGGRSGAGALLLALLLCIRSGPTRARCASGAGRPRLLALCRRGGALLLRLHLRLRGRGLLLHQRLLRHRGLHLHCLLLLHGGLHLVGLLHRLRATRHATHKGHVRERHRLRDVLLLLLRLLTGGQAGHKPALRLRPRRLACRRLLAGLAGLAGLRLLA